MPYQFQIDQDWNMNNINHYICPDIVVATLLMIVLALLFAMISCQLMAVQCNSNFAEKGINFGKIEETE